MSFCVSASASASASSYSQAAFLARFPHAAKNIATVAEYFVRTSQRVKQYIVNLILKQFEAVRTGDILGAIAEAEKGSFTWGVYMDPKGVGHTGIALFIGESCFTIDYGAVGETVDHFKHLMGDDTTVKGVVEYKALAEGEPLREGASLQSFDLGTTIGRSRATAVASALLAKDSRPYNVRTSNCRHHVKRCINRVVDLSEEMQIGFDVDPKKVLSELEELLFGGD